MFSSCEKKVDKKAINNSESVEMNQEKENDLSAIVNSYLTLSEALVLDDEDAAAKAAGKMLAAYTIYPKDNLEEALQKKFTALYKNSKEHLEHIAKSELSHQRSHFKALSQDSYELVVMLKAAKTLYKSYCPMYNDNKGGMWLSASKDIRNPYFGSKMLKCGTVKETIRL